MRTLSSNESKIYDAGGFSVRLRVVVKDETGNDLELTNLEGRSWVEGVEISDDIDQPVADATVTLVGMEYDLNLSPGVTGSKINRPGGTLQARLGINREIWIETALVPEHGGETSSEWRRIFHGDVDEIDLPSDGMSTQIRLRCRDKGGRLQRRWLERTGQRDLGDPTNLTVAMYETEGEDVEDVMGEILSDWGPAGASLVTPVSPGWEIPQGTWEPEMTNVLEVLRSLASRIGWVVKYCWNGSAFELRFFEPPRTKSTPDFTLGPDKYFSISRFSDSLSGVRNRVEVFYRKGSEEDAETDSEVREDTTSQTKYGILYASIGENETTGITDSTKAGALAQAILDDLKEPRAQLSATSIFLYHVELYDLIRFSPNGLLFDTNQDLSVVGYRHTLTADRIETELICRPGVAGSWKRWWDKIGDGEKGESVSAPPAPTLTATPTIRGVKLSLDGIHLRHRMIEWHVSTTSSFTPSGSTLRARSVATSQVLSDLSQGTTYYAKAVVVSTTNIPSPPSNEVTFQPSQAATSDIANSAITDGKLGSIIGTNLIGGDGALTWLSSAGKLVKAFLLGAGSPATDLQLRSVDGEIRAENSGGTEGPYFRGASLKEGTGPLTKLSSAGLLDFTAAHPGKGALATKNAVDLGTGDVTATLPKAKVDSSGAWSQAEIPTLDKTKISATGTFAQTDIPTLDKTKISSTGTFAQTDIPTLDKTKISATGTFAQSDIPTLDKTKISSTGTFAQGDIPTLDKGKINSTGSWTDAEIPVLSTAKYASALLQDGSRRADFIELKDAAGTAHRRLRNSAGKFATLDTSNAEQTTIFSGAVDFEQQTTFQNPTHVRKAWADGMPYVFTADASGTNHVANPSFENDTSGWEEYSPSDDAPTLTRVTSERIFGNACLLVDSNDATPSGEIGVQMTTAAAVAAADEDLWVASAWVKLGAGNAQVNVSVQFLNSSNSPVSSFGLPWIDGASDSGWSRVWGFALATDAATAKVRMRVTVSGASGPFDLYVDACQLERVNDAIGVMGDGDNLGPSSYFDGTMTGCSWSGTPNASTSSRTGGLVHHGALAAPGVPPFVLYDDGEVSCGPITPSTGTAVRIGTAGRPLRIAGAGASFPDSIYAQENDVFFRTDSRSLFFFNGSAWVQISVGADSAAPGSPQTNQRIWDTDTKSENYYNGSTWKSSPFAVLLDDEIHFWDLATDPGSIAAQGRANVGVSATGCTTTMIFWGWITSTLGLEISGSGVETGTDFAQHFCSSNGTLTHVFYNRDATNSSDRRSANSCTMGVDWS